MRWRWEDYLAYGYIAFVSALLIVLAAAEIYALVTGK